MSLLENDQLDNFLTRNTENTKEILENFLVFIRGNDTFGMYRGYYFYALKQIEAEGNHPELVQECLRCIHPI